MFGVWLDSDVAGRRAGKTKRSDGDGDRDLEPYEKVKRVARLDRSCGDRVAGGSGWFD